MDNKEKWGLVDDYFSVNGFVFGTEKCYIVLSQRTVEKRISLLCLGICSCGQRL